MSSLKDLLGFAPNQDQETAFKNIMEWANNPMNNDPVRILGGYSGSGKSSVTSALAKSLKNVVLCAPTNKAVKVLAAMGSGCPSMTIYSLLGLRMSQHEDTLILKKAERDKVNDFQYVFIDECGMVNSELLDYIESAIRRYGVKVLFIGDPKQLNPVGESLSLVWKKYEIEALTIVERHDNQILNFATEVRSKAIDDIEMKSDFDDRGGVWSLNGPSFKNKVIEFAKQGEFSKQTRAIAWRNKTVDALNSLIRDQIYGENKKRFMKDELIVFTSPYVLSEYESIITDSEAYVKSWSVSAETVDSTSLKFYSMQIESDDGKSHTIKVLHEDSIKDFTKVTTGIADAARNCKDGQKRKGLWDAFWALKEEFAEIKYGYALTAHRAQGSTFENAFVDMSDILSNTNEKEAKRCLYVAVTRPTTRLFLK